MTLTSHKEEKLKNMASAHDMFQASSNPSQKIVGHEKATFVAKSWTCDEKL